MDYIITTIKKTITNENGEVISRHHVIIPTTKTILQFNDDKIVALYSMDNNIGFENDIDSTHKIKNYIDSHFIHHLNAMKNDIEFYKNNGKIVLPNFEHLTFVYNASLKNTIKKLYIVLKSNMRKNALSSAMHIIDKMLYLIKTQNTNYEFLSQLYFTKAMIESRFSDFDSMIESLKLAKDSGLSCIHFIINDVIMKEHFKNKELQNIVNEIIQKYPEHNEQHKEEYEAILKTFESPSKSNGNKRKKTEDSSNSNKSKKSKK